MKKNLLKEIVYRDKHGEYVLEGIDTLKKYVKSTDVDFEPFDNGKLFVIDEVLDTGIKCRESGKKSIIIPYEKLDDRYNRKDGILISNIINEYFVYFKLSDNERDKFPYDFNIEKIADMKDKFKVYEENLMQRYKNKIRIKIKEEINKIVK